VCSPLSVTSAENINPQIDLCYLSTIFIERFWIHGKYRKTDMCYSRTFITYGKLLNSARLTLPFFQYGFQRSSFFVQFVRQIRFDKLSAFLAENNRCSTADVALDTVSNAGLVTIEYTRLGLNDCIIK
jgi:hypothetical protein